MQPTRLARDTQSLAGVNGHAGCTEEVVAVSRAKEAHWRSTSLECSKTRVYDTFLVTHCIRIDETTIRHSQSCQV